MKLFIIIALGSVAVILLGMVIAWAVMMYREPFDDRPYIKNK